MSGSEDASVPRVLRMNGQEVKCDLSGATTGSEVYEALLGDPELTCSALFALLREEGEVLPRSAAAITLHPGEMLTLVVRSVFSVRAMLLQERDDLMSQMQAFQVSMNALHVSLADIDCRAQRIFREESISISSASSGVLSQNEVRILLRSITDPHELLEDIRLAARSRFELLYQSAKLEAECKPVKSKAWCQVASFARWMRLDSRQVPTISLVTAAQQVAAFDIALVSPACKTDWWLRLLSSWSTLQCLQCQREQRLTEVRQLHEELLTVAARLTELQRLWNGTLLDTCKARNSDGSLIQDLEQLEDAFRKDPLDSDDELSLLGFMHGVEPYYYLYDYWYEFDARWEDYHFSYCFDMYDDVDEMGDCPQYMDPWTNGIEDPWASKHDFRKWYGDFARQRAQLASTLSSKKDDASLKNAAGRRQAVKQSKLSKKKGGRFKPGEHALF